MLCSHSQNRKFLYQTLEMHGIVVYFVNWAKQPQRLISGVIKIEVKITSDWHWLKEHHLRNILTQLRLILPRRVSFASKVLYINIGFFFFWSGRTTDKFSAVLLRGCQEGKHAFEKTNPFTWCCNTFHICNKKTTANIFVDALNTHYLVHWCKP